VTKSEMAAKLNESGGWVPGKTVKIDFGDQGVLFLDGIGERVTEEGDEADTTISVEWADLQALGRGELDPMSALMQGRLRIAGDMANALQLQSVIAKMRD
jgi:putative sterol carrier protein